MAIGIVVIEAPGKPFALVDGQIKLEFVGAAGRRIRSRGVFDRESAVAEVESARPPGLHARSAVEETGELGQRDRLDHIEIAHRMAFPQQARDRRDRCHRFDREPAEVDALAGPAGPQGGRRRNGASMGIEAADRVGVAAFGAMGVE